MCGAHYNCNKIYENSDGEPIAEDDIEEPEDDDESRRKRLTNIFDQMSDGDSVSVCLATSPYMGTPYHIVKMCVLFLNRTPIFLDHIRKADKCSDDAKSRGTNVDKAKKKEKEENFHR